MHSIADALTSLRDHFGFADFREGQREVIAAILKTGEAFFGGTTWRGKRAMRISVTNWRTTDAEVDRVVEAVASVLGARR